MNNYTQFNANKCIALLIIGDGGDTAALQLFKYQIINQIKT